MTKKLPPEIKQQRKLTRVACSFCHSKHLQCDDTRPCKNCVKRGHQDTCRDVEHRKKKPKKQVTSKEVTLVRKNHPAGPSNNAVLDLQNISQQLQQVVDPTNSLHYSTIGQDSSNSTVLEYNNRYAVSGMTAIPKAGSTTNPDEAQQGPPPENVTIPGRATAANQADKAAAVPVKRKRGRPRKVRADGEVPVKKPRKTKAKATKKNKQEENDKVDKENNNVGLGLDMNMNMSMNMNMTLNPNSKSNVNVLPPLQPLSQQQQQQQQQTQTQTQQTSSHLPLLNLANVSLSNVNLDGLVPSAGYSLKHDNSLSALQLPSFSDLKAPLFQGLSDMKSPKFDLKPFNMSPLIKESKFSSSFSNFNLSNAVRSAGETENSQLPSTGVHNNKTVLDESNPPETPGSPLEFSVSGSSRTNTIDRRNHPLHEHQSSHSDTISNFESNVANDEYTKLKSMLHTTQPTPNPTTPNFMNNVLLTDLGNTRGQASKNIDPSEIDSNTVTNDFYNFENIVNIPTFDMDDDEDIRPFILINLDDGTMISSYPNNCTPNSYVYNADHSQMKNTAKEIPKDFEQNEDYTSPLIMRHVIKQPDDIYLTNIVKAYIYPKAYHALIAYLKKRFNKLQLLEIAKCMAKYRPSFISATKNLFENDLIFTERSFQRTLLEYENLISMSPSPTIIWRRTGEIVALTNEFAVMTGYSKMSLLTKRTFIVELMDDESTINYFKSFSEFAFGDLNATHLTDCNLRKADDNNYLRCCCVWTIKRDVFDIPMLIVGQFLPVLE